MPDIDNAPEPEKKVEESDADNASGTDADSEPWDEARSKAKIHSANREAAGLRARLKSAEEKAAKFDEIENSKKDELTKAQERIAEMEAQISKRDSSELRSTVARDSGLTAAQARWLVGSTKEELEASAIELKDSFSSDDGPATPRPGVKQLTGGRNPAKQDDTAGMSPSELAQRVLASRR